MSIEFDVRKRKKATHGRLEQSNKGTLNIFNYKDMQRSPEAIAWKLDILITEQQSELKELNLDPFLSKDVTGIFKAYKTTPRYKKINLALREEIKKMKTDKEAYYEDFDILDRYAGSIFQELAFYITTASKSPQGMVLSPDRTYEFFKLLYPYKQKQDHLFDQNSILGVSVPDGLLLSKYTSYPRVSHLLEYKASKKEHVLKQFSIYQTSINRLIGHWPTLFSDDLQLEYVVPNKQSHVNPFLDINTTITTLPFNYSQLGEFVSENFYNETGIVRQNMPNYSK